MHTTDPGYRLVVSGYLVDRLNDCHDLRIALRRTGPGDADTLDHLIECFNAQLRTGAEMGLDLGIDDLTVDSLQEETPALWSVIEKLEAALERLGMPASLERQVGC